MPGFSRHGLFFATSFSWWFSATSAFSRLQPDFSYVKPELGNTKEKPG